MTLYHFCAMRDNGSCIEYFDGTIRSSEDIGTRDGYTRLKQVIKDGFEPVNDSGVILLSLTRIAGGLKWTGNRN